MEENDAGGSLGIICHSKFITGQLKNLFESLNNQSDASDVAQCVDGFNTEKMLAASQIFLALEKSVIESPNDNENKDIIAECLKLAIETCNHLLSIIQLNGETVNTIVHQKKMIEFIMEFIKESYLHCKESRILYGQHNQFNKFSSDLSILFKSTYQLQKVFLENLEVYEKEDAAKEHFDDVTKYAFNLLLDICDVLNGFDATPMVNTWKTIKRFLEKFDLLDDDNILEKAFTSLCKASIAKMEDFCVSNETTSPRLMKVLRFLWGNVIQISKMLPTNADISHLLSMFCDMLRFCIEKVNNSATSNEKCLEVYSCFSNVIDAVVKDMMDGHAEKLMSFLSQDCPSSNDNCLANVVLFNQITETLSKVLNKNPSLLDASNIQILDVMDKGIQLLKSSRSELCINTQVLSIYTSPLRLMPVYDQSILAMYHLLLVQCNEQFFDIEKYLLNKLLSGDAFESLVALDVWTLLSRSYPDQVLIQQLHFLSQLILHFKTINPTKSSSHLALQMMVLCLNNLINMASSVVQEKFYQSFKPSPKTLMLWLTIDMEYLTDSIKHDVASVLCRIVTGQLTSAVNSKNAEKMVTGFHDTCKLLEIHQTLRCLSSSQLTSLVEILLKLWTDLKQPALPCVVEPVLKMTKYLFFYMQPTQFLELLQCMQRCLDKCKAENVLLLCCDFLTCLNTTRFDTTVEIECLGIVVSLFQMVSSSLNWIVFDASMEALKSFAETTPYIKAVPSCLPTHLHPHFKDYLHKMPHKSTKQQSRVSLIETSWNEMTTQPYEQSPCEEFMEETIKEQLDQCIDDEIRTDETLIGNNRDTVKNMMTSLHLSIKNSKRVLLEIPDNERTNLIPTETINEWNELLNLTK